MNHSALALAYIGDAIYEIYIRKHLLNKGIEKVKDLQESAVPYVSAKGQEKYLREMQEKQVFTEEELAIIKRGRNSAGTRHPKNTDIMTYKNATGLESLVGYLYMQNNQTRIAEIMKYIIGE